MNAALPPVAIEGVAFWHTRLPGWATARAVICGEQDAPAAAATRPTPSLLAPTERRRAPDTVALALEVAARACEAAGRSPAQLRSVFASTYGDLGISDYMCATLAGHADADLADEVPQLRSQRGRGLLEHRHCQSRALHGASALIDIRSASGVLEAATQVVCDGQPVMCVAFDVESTGPLATVAPSRGLLGVALVLAPIGWRVPSHADVACRAGQCFERHAGTLDCGCARCGQRSGAVSAILRGARGSGGARGRARVERSLPAARASELIA